MVVNRTVGLCIERSNMFVYLLTNQRNTVLYCGVTHNLVRRVYEHKHKLAKGFTQKYNCEKLVYFEVFDDAISAITREKEIKGWRREKKDLLVDKANPQWLDLYSQIV